MSLPGQPSVAWREARILVSHGVRVGVRASCAGVLALLEAVLPPRCRPSSSSRAECTYSVVAAADDGFELYEDAQQVSRSDHLAGAVETLSKRLRLFVAERARGRVFVHAGAVAVGGVAVLLPGRSFSGKTSLVRELVRRGAVYYSDEYAVLDGEGRVHPFPQPLGVRDEGAVQRPCSVAEVGGVAGTRPVPVGLVLLTQFREGARWRPRHLSLGQGVLQTLAHAVAARRDPARVLQTLECALAHADILTGRRGDAVDVAPRLLQRARAVAARPR